MDTVDIREPEPAGGAGGPQGFDFAALGLGPPPRSRPRGRPDPLTRILLIALALAVSFAAGAQVGRAARPPAGPQPGAGSGTGATSDARGSPAGPETAPAAGEVTAQVKLVDGTTIHLVDRRGRLMTVETTGATRLIRTQSGSLHDLLPGDTVGVRGHRGPDGVISAVTLTYATGRDSGSQDR